MISEALEAQVAVLGAAVAARRELVRSQQRAELARRKAELQSNAKQVDGACSLGNVSILLISEYCSRIQTVLIWTA